MRPRIVRLHGLQAGLLMAYREDLVGWAQWVLAQPDNGDGCHREAKAILAVEKRRQSRVLRQQLEASLKALGRETE